MLEISDGDLIAQIMEEGAYLYSLTKSGRDIILKGQERKTHGGMALLIPYANRVKDGTYIWEGKKYELPRNAEGNAIHGLIMDKVFDVKFKGKNRITLEYVLDHPGYPSTLRITVTYSVVFNLIDVFITVKNEGEISAPLVVGAHPYFIVRGRWSIIPSRVRRCLMENKIPNGSVEDFTIIQKDYDDCFIIEDREVILKSDYSTVTIEKSEMDYIQIYTGEPNAVAVEPMSGAPDAFHNKLGLIVLEPSRSHNFNFTISAVIH